MRFIYEIIIRLYSLLVWIASAFNTKAKAFIKGRKGGVKALLAQVNTQKPTLWMHAASLGEFEQGRPIIERLKIKYPKHQILLTFFSPSGYEVRKGYEQADQVCYLPIDSYFQAKRFVYELNLSAAIIIKYEFWHNYIYHLHQKQVPTYVVSTIFRPEQIFFKSYGTWFKKSLQRITQLFVQDQDSLDLLQKHGVTQSQVIGDTRFDRVADVVKNAPDFPLIAAFCQGHKLIVAGSTWEPDEQLLLQYMEKHQETDIKLIIAPHEVTSPHIKSLCKQIALSYQLYSEVEPNSLQAARILIIDTIGLLSSIYRYGDFAYIGGGFGVGIHNILEAATYGMPVIFGPNYKKFREAREMISKQAARSISDYEQLETCFDNFLNHPHKLKQSAQQAKEYVLSNLGATDIFMQYIDQEITNPQ